jgi:5'-3' exonuclease
MGVPSLFAWLKKRYPYRVLKELRKTIKRFNKQTRELESQKVINIHVDELYIDTNSLLHRAAQWVYGYGDQYGGKPGVSDPSYEEVGKRVIHLILESIILTKVKYTLVIAVDGPAPLAKVQQQRQRRTIAAAKANMASEVDEESQEGIDQPASFDPSMISPGTPFMDLIDQMIRDWLHDNPNLIPKNTSYYPHRLPGEGEHKLFNVLGKNPKGGAGLSVSGGVLSKNNQGAKVIYADDNDLIIISLIRARGSYLMRPERGNPRNPVPQTSSSTIFEFVDIDGLRGDLQRMYDISPEDFSILVLLCGNDFIPPSPACFDVFTTLDTALALYKAIREKKLTMVSSRGIREPFILYKDGINWDDLFLLFLQLLKNEDLLLMSRYTAEHDRDGMEKEWSTPDLNKSVHHENGIAKLDIFLFRDLYHESILPKTIDKGVVLLDIVEAYFEAMVWSTTYYIKGVNNVNVEWYYRYWYAPMFTEVVEVLRELRTNNRRWTYPAIGTNGVFLNPLQQQVCILPLTALNQALYGDKDVRPEIIEKVYEPLIDLYPEDVRINREGKSIADRAVIELPFIDPKRVKSIAASLNRPDIAILEKEPLKYPFDRKVGMTVTGRQIRTKEM